ncbi:G-type lectin S-receptor-like serine/threonine-protein kinase LECRK3 [Coffea eugenioides]|uniref:G-type lectin S-receptor-like serine/threonine-protein kinase LECRK3 n=1 Tax=Coffea eugenioides TaxID=49369 RepID=UPI000F60AC3C|nr:G-type lectin S-receptor-like serine/threonine-protein kinase LECRK3 [Coffea eugenioides]
MAAFLFFVLSSAFYSGIAAQKSPLNISLGSSLTPTGNSSSWLSPTRIFAFGFYQQRNGYAVGIFLAGIPQKTAVWTANRDNPIFSSNVSLILSTDGRLILQQPEGQDITVADPLEPISSASMLDSGNFVLYNSDKEIIWQSFEHPTNSLLPRQQLIPGQELISSASETDDSMGIFRLAMQIDGNLVQYPVGAASKPENAYWASGTFGDGPNITLNLQDDGHLYLTNSSVNLVKNLSDGGHPKNEMIYLMKIDVDGIFRLYSHSIDEGGNWSIIWESSTDKCDPKGLCGFNSFCTKIDNLVDCKCPPGFQFVNQGNWRLGCERCFVTENCNSTDSNVNYTIEFLENTVWEDDTFFIVNTSTKDDCANVCLEDCSCEAAFFKDGQCKKQKLPLTYGKRAIDSNIALVKVHKRATVDEGVIPSYPLKCRKEEVRVYVLIIGISLAVLAVLISVIAGVYVHRNQVWAYKQISRLRNVEFLENVAPRAFTFAELEQATNEFGEELGRGASGAVYKGILPDSEKVVAVKKLEKVLAESEMEFQNEIKVIGKTHHRNLVRLLGYCLDGAERLLVYEYMSNGSLADVLLKPENHPSWDERTKIARDIARGILYLHEECETQIIHCDIKPQNILMDENRCPKISDFGLAKLLKRDQTRTHTTFRGTKGYVAPEWYRKMPVTVKADVYSFGIVLLEIICCRKSLDWSFSEDEAVLEEWAYHCFKAGELHKLVGDQEVVDMRKLERMMKIALWCIQDEPALRPSMKKVLLMLEGTVDIPDPPSPTSFLSST